MKSITSSLLFPVPSFSLPLPAHRPGHCEVHEIITEKNYCIPLIHLPRLQYGDKSSSKTSTRTKNKTRNWTSREDGKVLIVSHGNACNLAEMYGLLEDFRESFGVSVIGYEYIGYNHTRKIKKKKSKANNDSCFSSACDGNDDKSVDKSVESEETEIIPHTEITPSEKGCYDSIGAAHQFITENLGIPEHRQVWLGISIGSGPTIDLVSRLNWSGRSLGGMILVSPFYSATRVVSELLAYFYDPFPNYSKMGKVKAPTLILHGSLDEVIPADHSKRLEKHYLGDGCQRYVIEGAGHNDILVYEEAFTCIRKFLRTRTGRQVI